MLQHHIIEGNLTKTRQLNSRMVPLAGVDFLLDTLAQSLIGTTN